MKKLKQILFRDGKGDIAIEALFGLIIFILAYMGVLMFSTLMRLEATTQYAVDQVAKEVSQYYYVLEKTDLLLDEPGKVDVNDTDSLIENGNNAISGLSALMGSSVSGSDTAQIAENAKSFGRDANAVYETIKAGDWGTQLTNIMSLTLNGVTDRIFGKVIAGPVCKMLFEKYIPADDPDEYFRNYGIEDGMDGLDFTYSTFIQDGYTINVVLIYKLNLKNLTFGIFDKDIYIRQVGSTQAWIHYLNDKNDEITLWDIEGNFPRGKEIVAYIENNYGESIAPGVGFDAYDAANNTLTEVHTIDLYDTTCINEDGSLNSSILKQRFQGYANKSRKHLDKVQEGAVINVNGEEIALTGQEKHQLVIVLPKEAEEFSDDIEIIKSKIREDNGNYDLDNIIIAYEMKGKN